MTQHQTPSLLSALHGDVIEVAGRVTQLDGQELRIADAFATLSIHCREATEATPGDWVVVRGRLVGARLLDASVLEVTPALLPRDGEFQRFTTAGHAQALRRRMRAEALVRRYFVDQGFVEVRTPRRVSAPGTDPYIDPIASAEQWLITSPEFHMKRLLCGGLPRIVQFASCFRDDEHGAWHEPEFTLLEWYRAFADQDDVIADAERIVAVVAAELAGGALTHGERQHAVEPPFERVTVRDLFREHAGIDDASDFAREREADYFQTWVDQIQPALDQRPAPIFVTEYPITQAALARPCPHDETVAERFELFVLGVELCNGFGELTDALAQRQRFEADNEKRRAQGKPELPIDEALLAALAEGMPRAAGNALGFERLLALCEGTTLDGVVPFPARQE